jgi:predicted Zn-dependent protease
MIVILRMGLMALLAGLVGCAVNPVSGKTDFVMMTEQQELDLGRRYSQEIARQHPAYADQALQNYVQRIGNKLAQNSHRSNLAYQFTVVDSPDINAFALPGGHIYINRGLLAYLNSEAELAAVLGHELGHVTARHGVQQQSQAQAWGILSQVVAVGTGVGIAGDLTNVLGGAVVSGYGRDMELQADALGAEYLARAGYDPQAMIEVVKVLKAQEDYARDQARLKGKPEPAGYHGLFATHPDNDSRLQQVINAAAPLLTGKGTVNREVFLQHLQGLPFGDSEASGVRRGQQFLHADLGIALDIPQGWEMQNRPEVLIFNTSDQQAFIAMTLDQADPRLTPAEILRRRLGTQRLSAEETLNAHGLQGVTGVIAGRPARRMAVVVKGDNAFMFVAQVKNAPLESSDQNFMAVISSLRPLAANERKLAEPLRLQIVKVKSGDSMDSLARSNPAPADKPALLRLLNGLYPNGQPAVGDALKIPR